MRILTWNINSVRLRMELLARIVAQTGPDIICLQEIKVETESFPAAEIAELGYPGQLVRGMKSYNGVAILSRAPLAEAATRDWCGKGDSRHVSAQLPGDIELHNFYVPAGGDIPDPEQNDKFAHKLDFVREMANWFTERAPGRHILVGDLNIAPLESDVWSHRQLLNVVSHTPAEVAKFERLMSSDAWVDAVRHFVPAEQRLYSWWSYRNRTWPGSDRGRRLDHVLVTAPVAEGLTGAEVLREARGWDKPSDHAPVWVDIDL